MANRPQAAADTGPRLLWFSPPDAGERPRRALSRERVVAEALTVISTDGAGALSMRALATRLGVVPAALYRHVRSKEQLLDLVVDGVLAEVDCQPGHALAWAGQVTVLAHRLRAVLDDHPGIAALLKTRDPLGPHSLALAEAFLAPLQAAGLPQEQTALAFSLIYDGLPQGLGTLWVPADRRGAPTAAGRMGSPFAELHSGVNRHSSWRPVGTGKSAGS